MDIVKNRSKDISKRFTFCGAGERTRTPDLRITNALLYRLSYTSIVDFIRLQGNASDAVSLY